MIFVAVAGYLWGDHEPELDVCGPFKDLVEAEAFIEKNRKLTLELAKGYGGWPDKMIVIHDGMDATDPAEILDVEDYGAEAS